MPSLLASPFSSPYNYLVVFFVLVVLEIIYFRIANRYDIIDNPNGRSSHTTPTLQGGGVIFWLAALLYVPLHLSYETLWFFMGITLIAVVSFIDDLINLGQKRRLVIHFLAISCAFIATNIFSLYPWWAIALSYIVFLGVVNVYNFMDGINGITSLNSIAVLLAMQYVNLFIHPFVLPDLIWYPIIACGILLIFNFRHHAKCFPGDVGSITIAFWVVSILLLLVLETNNLVWFGFLMVYGVDGAGTVIHRAYMGENIMRPHRIHLFQLLANEEGVPQRWVSSMYFVVQLIISATIIALYPVMQWWIFVILLVGLFVITYTFKFRLMRKHGLRYKRSQAATTVYD